ncbi:hypothetical protein [Streptomyces sp. NPDC051132]|uniref:hypothetical protein n=1 Tax=unclassified Streptomyces TaxID=2593676 RepID=UPI00343015CD
MIHSEESVAAELDRVRRRPAAASAPPVLAVRVWADSWGEPFFGSLDLLWLLCTAGAARVAGPEVREAGVWESEAAAR